MVTLWPSGKRLQKALGEYHAINGAINEISMVMFNRKLLVMRVNTHIPMIVAYPYSIAFHINMDRLNIQYSILTSLG